MEINNTILDLGDLVNTLTHSETWRLSIVVDETKYKIEELLLEARKMITSKEHFIELANSENPIHLKYVNTLVNYGKQLTIIEKNMVIITNALLCFEAKICEKRPSLKDLKNIWLN